MSTNTPADLAVRYSGPTTIVEFLDRRLIDAAQIERLGDQILEIIKPMPKPKLVIAFDKVEYLSSSALNILIKIENTINKKGGEFRLANLAPDLQKVFTMMKLNKVMKICDSVDEAVRSIKT